MVLDIPLVPVSLATVALESCLYGAYLVLSVLSVALMLSRYSNSVGLAGPAMPIFLLLGTVSLFVTITAHWILTVDRSFLAFLQFENGTFPLGFYGDISQVTEVVKTGFLMATGVIGDALLIHRLWIVWGRNKYVIIFPMCTLMGLTACGAGATYQFSQYQLGQNVFLSEAGRWITSDTVFTLCTNLYSTTLISWRIWKTSRAVRPYGGQRLKSVLSILIESAALYTSWNLFFFVSYEVQSNLQFIAADCWPAVAGISYMLIHVRLGWTQRDDQYSTGVTATQPVSVTISRAVHTSNDYQLENLGSIHDKGDIV